MERKVEADIIEGKVVFDVGAPQPLYYNRLGRHVTEVDFDGTVYLPVVRCRECSYLHGGVCYLNDGNGDYARWEVEPDGFCAWAVRRVD